MSWAVVSCLQFVLLQNLFLPGLALAERRWPTPKLVLRKALRESLLARVPRAGSLFDLRPDLAPRHRSADDRGFALCAECETRPEPLRRDARSILSQRDFRTNDAGLPQPVAARAKRRAVRLERHPRCRATMARLLACRLLFLLILRGARFGDWSCPRSSEDRIVETFAMEVGHVLHERHDQGMGLRFRGRELWLEQCRDKEQMSGRLDGAALLLRTAGYDRKASFHSHPFELGIQFVVAEEFFFDFLLSIKRRQVRAWTEMNLVYFPGEFGPVLVAIWNGAGYGVDHDILGLGIFFGGGSVANADDVAGALDERVLKAAAGAEKRAIVHAGELDAF